AAIANVCVPRVDGNCSPSIASEEIAASGDGVRLGHQGVDAWSCIEEIDSLLAGRNVPVAIEDDHARKLVVRPAISVNSLDLQNIAAFEASVKGGDRDRSHNVLEVALSREGHNFDNHAVCGKG